MEISELPQRYNNQGDLLFRLFLPRQKRRKFNSLLLKITNLTMKFFNRMMKVLLLVGLAAFLGGCASSGLTANSSAEAGNTSGKKSKKAKKEEVYNPAGVWEYTVETPDGGNAGLMRISGEPGNFEVMLETDQFGELRVYDLEMTGESMSGKIDVAGVSAEVEGDFDGESFSGAVILGDEAYPLEAMRTSKG